MTSIPVSFDTYDQLESGHAQMVAKLSVSGEDVLRRIDAHQLEVNHMALGVAGEAGELVDAVKKFIYYNQPIDLENVVEELGDLEFYMQGLRARLGISRERTLAANMAKLAKRYPNFEYSNQRAKERADKE